MAETNETKKILRETYKELSYDNWENFLNSMFKAVKKDPGVWDRPTEVKRIAEEIMKKKAMDSELETIK